jgi:hypothetical protein
MISKKRRRRRARRKRARKKVEMRKKVGLMWTSLISRIDQAGLLFILLHRREMQRYVRHLLMLRLILTLEIPSRW